MEKIVLIGVGPGSAGCLTLKAREAIDAADVVFAAKRHGALSSKTVPLEPLSEASKRIRAEHSSGKRVAVLVSGDPCLYSMLGMLHREFGAENIRVLPGIGAVQAFCARMGVLWQDAKIVSGHGRDLTVSALGFHVRTHEKTLLFCDKEHGAAWAAAALTAEGLTQVRMCVGERLSYADERITSGLPETIAAGSFDPLCVVWMENPSPEPGFPPFGLEDEAFLRGKIPMTKREIRMQVMAELNVRPDSVVWDLGAGTGSVSVECARACPMGRVFAVEQKDEGIELIRANAEKFRTNNLFAVEGIAPEVCANLPPPTHVFIGGSGGRMREILEHLRRLERPIRVVSTAVTLESIGELTDCFAQMENARTGQIAVSRGEALGNYHLLRAMNPVVIASGNIVKEAIR